MKSLAAAVAGRRIVVTGASSGIGRSLALRLGNNDCHLILVARREAQLREVATAIARRGGSASVYRGDLASADDAQNVASSILRDHGGVDVLINNAGRSIRRTVADSYDRLHDFERTMQINYFGALALALAFLPGMRRRGGGHIVNISSMATQNATPPFAAYNASKAALDAWSRTVGAELAHDGIAITTVYMPLVDTAMSSATNAYAHARMLNTDQATEIVCRALITQAARIAHPVGTVGEIFAAVSPGAHRHITGFALRHLPGFETLWRRRKHHRARRPTELEHRPRP
ncbi:MAG: SDR family NAD(P)-dependent oxidoreductase [Nocardioides sp.]|uniref:SDR family NAD(P)-dependent oxidoreductase n=1 Tax=Nocardioides sp. TaxID=35761 RepID=UPI0039E678C2